MKGLLRMEATVNLDAASDTTATTFKAPGAGYVNVKQIFGRFEEAVAAGGFSTAAGVASVVIGGLEVATWSTGVAATARAIGDTVQPTVDGTNVTAANGVIKVAAGDAIVMKTKTQGTGGTVTGEIRFYIPFEGDLG
jgi:hypothetical protein